jgi:hypothetical protein
VPGRGALRIFGIAGVDSQQTHNFEPPSQPLRDLMHDG